MKSIIIILGLVLSTISFGQTELIAYKSHSGNMAYFKAEKLDNLGGPPIRIDSIIKVNDSTIIEYNSYGWGYNNGGPIYTDTVVNHPICKVPVTKVDSLKSTYYRKNIKFIGFDSTSTTDVKDTVILNSVPPTTKNHKPKKRKNKKNETVFPANSNNNTNSNQQIEETKNISGYLFTGLAIFLIAFTTIVWFTNRRKMVMP